MNGKKMKYYRLKKGLTTDELAKIVGCSKGAISLYENNEREPSYETGEKIASALGVSWLTLSLARELNLKFNHFGFRRKQKVSQRDIEMLKIEIEEKCTDRVMLMDILGLVNEKPFKAKKLSFDNSVSENAYEIRKALMIPPIGPIFSITQVLEHAGIIVLSFPCIEEIDGLNGMVNDIPYIFFNSEQTVERQRFTIIHELCHLFFNNVKTDLSDKEFEKYINRLAGNVLIPDSDLYHEFGKTNRNLTVYIRNSAAKKYKIAPSCLITRLYEADIVTEMYYKSFFIYLNRNGGRKLEPSFLNKDSDSEAPTLFEYQVYRALSEELITASRAAELLHIPLYNVMENARME